MLFRSGSADFLALNHYYSWVTKDGYNESTNDYNSDVNATNTHKQEWKKSDIGFSIVPQGMHDVLMFMHNTWMKNSSLPIYITENGVSVAEPTIESALSDNERIDFLASYLTAIEKAIEKGVKVEKYFVWSLLDNFEWNSGLSSRFGLTRVEYKDGYRRIPKASLRWYGELIKSIH